MELYADSTIALAIHAASTLDEEQAVNWLSVQSFTLDQFNTSRKVLGLNEPGRRNNQETAAQDLIKFVQEGNSLPYKFVISPEDLFKLPGLSRECLELTNFQLGIELAKNSITKQNRSTKGKSSKSPETSFSAASAREQFPEGKKVANPQSQTGKTSERPWNVVAKFKQKKQQIVGVTSNADFKKPVTEVATVCVKLIAPEETTLENVSSILKAWKDIPITQEKVEIITRLPHYSSYRITVQVPKANQNFWKNGTYWPWNTRVMKWNGDHNAPIPPQNTRETTRRIVIGKVDASQPTEEIAKYIRNKVYGDISSHIKSIKVERKPNLAPDALHSAVCVTVTTNPGQEAAWALLEKGLMRNKYPEAISSSVRWWNYHLSPDWAKPKKKIQSWHLPL